jgi:hypothetical protein
VKRFLLVVLAATIFGGISGYLSVEIFNGIHVDSDRPHVHWYDSFMVSLAPGGMIDRLMYGNSAGFNLYEDWIDGDGLKDAVVFNALGWMIIAVVITCLISSIKLACQWIVGAFHAR